MSNQSRREFLKTIGSATISASALSVLPSLGMMGCVSGQGRRPNVVLILTDDQGYGDLGCQGNDKLKTPNIDMFYEDSVRFTNFNVCPLCSPTRASLMTGRYNYRTGVVDTWVGLGMMRSEEVTIAEAMVNAGYRTGIFGKWHLGDNYPLRAMDQGFQESLVHTDGMIGSIFDAPDNKYDDPALFHNGISKKYSGYCTDIFFNEALKFIEKESDSPFFAYISTNIPHYPLQISDHYSAPYRAMGLDNNTSRIYGMLTNLDENVGRLMQRLKDLRIDKDTLVIFMSDNGPEVPLRYNAGLRGTKSTVYEGGIRVPFFIRWPETLKEGRDLPQIAAHNDVLPTLFELCKIPKSSQVSIDGVSLVPLLRGDDVQWPDRMLFFQQSRPEYGDGSDVPRLFTHCAAKDQRYKIVMSAKGSEADRYNKAVGFEDTELYDLVKDPGEKHDISKEHPEIVKKMRKAYEEWFHSVTKGIDPPVCISLGAKEANPTTLTPQDLSGNRAYKAPWNWGRVRRMAKSEMDGYGHWNVNVIRSGNYEITCRLGPLDADWTPVLKTGEAYFKLNDVMKTQRIESGMKEIKFKVNLKAGVGKLEAYFTGQRKDGKKVSSFFVDVEYLDMK